MYKIHDHTCQKATESLEFHGTQLLSAILVRYASCSLKEEVAAIMPPDNGEDTALAKIATVKCYLL